jgi:dual specificity phosphatase 12
MFGADNHLSRFAARSLTLLQSLNIRYVLSATRSEDVPKYRARPEPGAIEGDDCTEVQSMSIKHIDIDDDPTENLVWRLKEACDWIDAGLKSSSAETGDGTQVGVLVHCTQGISRSGSIVVAYGEFSSTSQATPLQSNLSHGIRFCSYNNYTVMRTLSLPYADALSLVRQARPLVSPNIGFARQLKVWEECRYDVFVHNNEEEKAPYTTWKNERDELLRKGEEAVQRARVSAMGSMAAGFAQTRLEKLGEIGKEKGQMAGALNQTKTK